MCSGHMLHILLNILLWHMQRESSCNTKQLIIMQVPSLNSYQSAQQQLETVYRSELTVCFAMKIRTQRGKKKKLLFRCVPSLSLCYCDYWKVSSNKLIISIIISASFKSSLESQKNEQMNKSLDLI